MNPTNTLIQLRDPELERKWLALGAYVRLLADLLSLRDWTFVLSDAPAAEGANAQIETLRGRKRAELRVAQNFFLLPPVVQRQCLVHELLHCHFAPCGFVAHDALPRRFQGMFDINLEYGIDGIADCVALLLPLPNWEESPALPPLSPQEVNHVASTSFCSIRACSTSSAPLPRRRTSR